MFRAIVYAAIAGHGLLTAASAIQSAKDEVKRLCRECYEWLKEHYNSWYRWFSDECESYYEWFREGYKWYKNSSRKDYYRWLKKNLVKCLNELKNRCKSCYEYCKKKFDQIMSMTKKYFGEGFATEEDNASLEDIAETIFGEAVIELQEHGFTRTGIQSNSVAEDWRNTGQAYGLFNLLEIKAREGRVLLRVTELKLRDWPEDKLMTLIRRRCEDILKKEEMREADRAKKKQRSP